MASSSHCKEIHTEKENASSQIQFLVENVFLTYKTVLFYFSGAGKICLAHGLRQLTRDVKNDVRTLNFRSNVTCDHHEKLRMTFGEDRYAAYIVKNNKTYE